MSRGLGLTSGLGTSAVCPSRELSTIYAPTDGEPWTHDQLSAGLHRQAYRRGRLRVVAGTGDELVVGVAAADPVPPNSSVDPVVTHAAIHAVVAASAADQVASLMCLDGVVPLEGDDHVAAAGPLQVVDLGCPAEAGVATSAAIEVVARMAFFKAVPSGAVVAGETSGRRVPFRRWCSFFDKGLRGVLAA